MKRKIILAGASLVIISQVILGLIFYPVLAMEVKYQLRKPPSKLQTIQASSEFRIFIPKVNIDSKVFPNIDPFNKNEYFPVLSKGIAQAKGSSLPGESGNVFLFAHSTDSPTNVVQYNAVFYLISKLRPGDEVDLVYQGRIYKYIIDESKIISPSEINYLQQTNKGKSLTLMTCWPPGTTLKRLLILSHLK